MKISDSLEKAAESFRKLEVIERDLSKYAGSAREQTESRQEALRTLENTAEEAGEEVIERVSEFLWHLRYEHPDLFSDLIDRFTVIRNAPPRLLKQQNPELAEDFEDVLER